jgi:hypothetical protein
VIFVFPDEPMALAVAKLADGLVRGRIASLEDRQAAWPYPGRRRMFFCAERDAHEGSLRGLMLPELPAAVRRAAQRLKGRPMTVELARRDIIRRDVLELHAGP